MPPRSWYSLLRIFISGVIRDGSSQEIGGKFIKITFEGKVSHSKVRTFSGILQFRQIRHVNKRSGRGGAAPLLRDNYTLIRVIDTIHVGQSESVSSFTP